MRPEEMREGYIGWCPHVDAMATGESKGWSSTQDLKAEEFIDQWLPIDPDYNAIIDFFFVRQTPTRECETCGGSGYNAETQNIADAYYDFEETGNRWCDKLTDDEIEALMEYRKLSREEAVARMKDKGIGGCDALDRWMLIEVRAKRLGVWGKCEDCGGEGQIPTEPEMLVLNLWMTHPRKGAARGLRITHVEESHLPVFYALLRDAERRLRKRFENVPFVTVDSQLFEKGFPDIAGAMFNPR